MIILKTEQEIAMIKEACRITASVFVAIEPEIKAGISTYELDQIVYNTIVSQNAIPAFLNYGDPPFPGSACISINEEVVHGIPSKNRYLKDGDIVSIDVGAEHNGYFGDACRTFLVGDVNHQWKKLVKVTEQSFWKGIEQVKKGNRLGDIGHAVQTHCENHGFGVIRELTGHGIGANLHEDPNLLNYGRAGRGIRLEVGMAMCLEPMITEGSFHIQILPDQWTIVTADRKAAAHYENTFAITKNGVEILTLTASEREQYAEELTQIENQTWA
ncbi:MAG: type I methionyl aminopeptidase [Clostridiaceae bacterium]|nr:type I methionyl aminopeptidase [Clostridiaceae bacterium]